MARRHSQMRPLGTRAPRFALRDTVGGRTVALEDFAASPALLIAFICNHCPYVKHILEGVVAFARDFGARGLAVVAISSNDVEGYPEDAPAEMARIATLKGFTFPYLYDESQQVAKAYQAVCTPDFFLFDRDRRLAYRRQHLLDCQLRATGAILENQALDRARTAGRRHAKTAPLAATGASRRECPQFQRLARVEYVVGTPARISQLYG